MKAFCTISFFLLGIGYALAQESSDTEAYQFTVVEAQLMEQWKEDSTSFKVIYGLGILYYNQGVQSILSGGKSNIDFDSIPEAVYNLRKSLSYLEKAHQMDSTNENVKYALEGVGYALGDKKDENYVDPQAFRVVDGDTINAIDEIGMLQGEWERLHPDGSFRCRGAYKDNKKEGYWERKWTNGNWQYQVNFKNGYPHGHGKWFYSNGQVKNEGNYENGRSDGIFKNYYDTGAIKSEITYVNGSINGICNYYNEDGTLTRTGFLNVENREGEWKFYSDKGKHTMSVIYEAGVAVETITVKK